MSTVLLAYSNSLSFLPVALILRVFLGGGGGENSVPRGSKSWRKKKEEKWDCQGRGKDNYSPEGTLEENGHDVVANGTSFLYFRKAF